MSAQDVSALPGWYGKLPALGDFGSRRLPTVFVRTWDTWLQSGLSHAQAALGEHWLEVYLVAPIWRFWLAPRVLGRHGWAGILMPSVDRVGRPFPLTVAWSVGSLAAAMGQPRRFESADAAARQALDVEVGVDDFEVLLAQAAADARPDPGSPQTGSPADATGVANGASGSLWWLGESSAPRSLHRYAGLPPPAAFTALIEASP